DTRLGFHYVNKILRATQVDDRERGISLYYQKIFGNEEDQHLTEDVDKNLPLQIRVTLAKYLIQSLNFENDAPLQNRKAINQAINIVARYLSLDEQLIQILSKTLILSIEPHSVYNGLLALSSSRNYLSEKKFKNMIYRIRYDLAYASGRRDVPYINSQISTKCVSLLYNLSENSAMDAITMMFFHRSTSFRKFLGWIDALHKLINHYESDYLVKNNGLYLNMLNELQNELLVMYEFLYPSLRNNNYNNELILASLDYINKDSFLLEIKKNKECDKGNFNESTCSNYLTMCHINEGIIYIEEIKSMTERFHKFRLHLKRVARQKNIATSSSFKNNKQTK
ncbi:MAG: hypothetical protein N3E37_02215, partial [Candidatus Micrarchaeota archaeon]|nr:hypothetical protein [Candidatus Micrarchaeota archaeon]